MGKRSNFERRERDCYDTPIEAVRPLIRWLPDGPTTYWEPCAGDGALVRALAELWPHGTCTLATDIEPRASGTLKRDAFDCFPGGPQMIITNPPWSRDILHPMIEHFALRLKKPTWLLFDADWMHTKQAAPYLDYCKTIVSVGRVKWIKDSPHTGKDNVCWYKFDSRWSTPTQVFVGRT